MKGNYMESKKRDEPYVGIFDDNFFGAASSTDLTGLIPANPASENEINSYKDVYNLGNEADRLTGKKGGKSK
ncbi:MAG: hypothetical protein FWG36_08810 [Oscillospiraceae bacterium]|nr:hypothetical protein [Oscillospiraceae bacterium]